MLFLCLGILPFATVFANALNLAHSYCTVLVGRARFNTLRSFCVCIFYFFLFFLSIIKPCSLTFASYGNLFILRTLVHIYGRVLEQKRVTLWTIRKKRANIRNALFTFLLIVFFSLLFPLNVFLWSHKTQTRRMFWLFVDNKLGCVKANVQL